MSDDEIEDFRSRSLEHFRKFEWKRMHYPSDAVTVMQMRELYPDDVPYHKCFEFRNVTAFVDLQNLMGLERELTMMVYGRAAGVHEHTSGVEYDLQWEVEELLEADYVRLGLAAGTHEAKVLVRGIAAQALAQAEQVLGRGRG